MFVFDRDRFFDAYRQRFGPLTQSLVDAIEVLLTNIEKDAAFGGTDVERQQLAYCLATFKWETAHTMKPIDEHGSANYFNKRYGPATAAGKRLGNTKTGDGARFHGRGYVQLTGRSNYAKATKLTGENLVANPDRSKEPGLAYLIAMDGMRAGWFTGKKLSQFIKQGAPPDYEGARRIVNGQDKAQTIADLARRFDEVLLAAI